VALRRDGHDVTVIDRLPPGEACSFGNSGAMPRNHAVPMSTPGILRKVPGYLLDPLGPLAFRWRHLPALAPWLVTFLRSSRPERFNHILTTLTRLMQQSHADWSVLLRDAGMTDRVRENGALSIYRSAEAREAAWPLWQMLIERGAKLDRLDEDALRAIEPGLPDGYCCAVLEHDYRHATDSHRIPMGLAEHFLRLGGVIRRETVSEIEIGPTGLCAPTRANIRSIFWLWPQVPGLDRSLRGSATRCRWKPRAAITSPFSTPASPGRSMSCS
jgi:D-amino-acid dehydrogenase